jgi:hypothetical protein
MNSGATANVVITARAPSSPPILPFSLIDTVSVSSTVADQFMTNNTTTIKTTVQGVPSIQVGVKPGSDRDLVISWPTAAMTYQLEYTDALVPANWQRYTNSLPIVSGSQNIVTISAPTNGMRFFRLRDNP